MFCAIQIGFLDLKIFISRFASIKRRFSFFQLFLCFHDFDPIPIARHLPTEADTNELQSAETNEQRRRLSVPSSFSLAPDLTVIVIVLRL